MAPEGGWGGGVVRSPGGRRAGNAAPRHGRGSLHLGQFFSGTVAVKSSAALVGSEGRCSPKLWYVAVLDVNA